MTARQTIHSTHLREEKFSGQDSTVRATPTTTILTSHLHGALSQRIQLIVHEIISTHLDGYIGVSNGTCRQEGCTMVAR